MAGEIIQYPPEDEATRAAESNERAQVVSLVVKKPRLPTGWRSLPLSEVASEKIVYGIVQAGPHDPDGIPYLKSSDVGGVIGAGALQRTSPAIHAKFGRSKVAPGDIVISLRGNTGATSVVPPELLEANLTQGTARIAVSKNHHSGFVRQQIASASTQRLIQAATKGSTFVEITLDDLRKVEILCPSRPEQQRIADILSTWDRAIETVEALITNAREQKSALMQALLSQGAAQPKVRLQGCSEEWRPVRLGQLVTEVSRDVDWDDDAVYQLISVRRRSEGIFHRESLPGRAILTKAMKVARAGDFLISKMQIVHGASALVSPEFDGYHISGSYIALVPNDHSNLDIEFFNWCSRTPQFYQLTYVSSYGVHIEKMTFNLKSFLNQTILIPPTITEQEAIVSRLNLAENLIRRHEKELVALRREKAGLMQQLLTGKRRVNSAEGEAV